MGKQLFRGPRSFWIAGGALLALGLIPGLPKLSFFSIAAVLMLAAWKMKPSMVKNEDDEIGIIAKSASTATASEPAVDAVDAVLNLDELMLEVGVGLVPLVDAKQGGQLLHRVKSIRMNLAQQLGFMVPSIHITDNLTIREREYVIYIRGLEIARWELQRACLLAISSALNAPNLPGQDTREPAFDTPAKWISPQSQGQAIAAGYAVVDPTSVLAAHLSEVIKRNASVLLSRNETKRLLDRLNDSHPKLTEELIPKLMNLGEVHRVLQQLLFEQVSIRDLGTILETLVDAASTNKNQIALVEAVRHRLGRALIRPLLNAQGELKVVTLDTSIEDECIRGFSGQPNQSIAAPQQVALARRVIDGLQAEFGKEVRAAPPILICPSPGRYHLHRLLEPLIPKIVVISPGEIPMTTPVQSVAVLH